MHINDLLQIHNEKELSGMLDEGKIIPVSNINDRLKLTARLTNIQKYGDGLSENALREAIRYNSNGMKVVPNDSGDHGKSYLAHFSKHKGFMCETLYNLTKDIDVAEQGYGAYTFAALLLNSLEDSTGAYQLKAAGRLANLSYIDTHKPEWLRRTMQAYRNSAELTENNDPSHSSNCYFLAGKAAKKIAKVASGNKSNRMFVKSRELLEKGLYLCRDDNMKDRINSELSYVNRMIGVMPANNRSRRKNR